MFDNAFMRVYANEGKKTKNEFITKQRKIECLLFDKEYIDDYICFFLNKRQMSKAGMVSSQTRLLR